MPKGELTSRTFGTFGPKTSLTSVVAAEHSVAPESAIVPGIAEGANGDKVGVFGSSVSGVAVWGRAGKAEALAGNFEGNVAVAGNMKVTGHFHAQGDHLFDGNLEVTGDIHLANADCAEDFDISGGLAVEPGTVMIMDADGALCECRDAYDRRVAGVISGAGHYKPAIVLDQRRTPGNRQPLGLVGKVFCKVDARFGTIAVGDLLTTSPTTGHAMKIGDSAKAFGAVIGKALRPLSEGQGLIPILIALQ